VNEERLDDGQKTMRLCTFLNIMPLGCVFHRVSLTLWGKSRVCAAESFAFVRRMSFSLEGTYVRKLLLESKTPESE